jgi:hypothetical protein
MQEEAVARLEALQVAAATAGDGDNGGDNEDAE